MYDYRVLEHVEDMKNDARTGRLERPGREFYMAQMAIDILGRGDLETLIYGAGRSLDNRHVATLQQVRHVAIADVMRVRDDAEFIDANLPAPRRFDIVVASEVIEHFLDPVADLAALFDFVEPEGLLVCSTNLYDGRRLSTQSYIFLPGHTSYWSEDSLRRVAAANGMLVDFRIPLVATGYGGPRKRYVLFTRSRAITDSIGRYFSTREYAPSDPPIRDMDLAAVTPAG
jgi:SAM-dependent methyltransferase